MNINELLFQSLGESALGIIIVFAVLLLIMVSIKAMTAVLNKKTKAEDAAPSAAAPVAAPAAAKGSCGEVILYDVPDKTAAMLMAITADKLGVPLNTLRFISIKEIEA